MAIQQIKQYTYTATVKGSTDLVTLLNRLEAAGFKLDAATTSQVEVDEAFNLRHIQVTVSDYKEG